MADIEFERTFLVRELPSDLKSHLSKEIIDIYVPADAEHAKLRIRKNGDKYTVTKKIPVTEGDASHQLEHTIELTKDEFGSLSQVPGRKLRKLRYYYPYQEQTCELDVFMDELSGLAVADFEFTSKEDLDNFIMPEFCLADITQEMFIAGGILAGKTYVDIESEVTRFGYKKLYVD